MSFNRPRSLCSTSSFRETVASLLATKPSARNASAISCWVRLPSTRRYTRASTLSAAIRWRTSFMIASAFARTSTSCVCSIASIRSRISRISLNNSRESVIKTSRLMVSTAWLCIRVSWRNSIAYSFQRHPASELLGQPTVRYDAERSALTDLPAARLTFSIGRPRPSLLNSCPKL
jgi:hypothetical protein